MTPPDDASALPWLPYSCQTISEDDIAAVVATLRSPFLTQGPQIPAFEAAFAARHAVQHAVAVSNATAGLHLACLALGVGPGTLVWTSPNSFLASANCALYCGADIDFVDIDARTRNMGVDALRAKLEQAAREGRLPQVVIPVDFAGLPCAMQDIRALADHYGFRIIEDASHATGASHLGQPVGSRHADLTVFSFHAVKIVTTAEGGIVTTQDAALAKQLRLLRAHGMTREVTDFQLTETEPWVYEQQSLGFNYRMTDLQAALGLSQLARLDALQAQRQALADRYDALLAELPLVLPPRSALSCCAWHLYVVEVDETRTPVGRSAVFQALRDARIGVNVHYIPIHTQPFYRARGFAPGDFPVAERYYGRALSLPLFPTLAPAQQQRVAECLRRVLEA